MIRLFKALNSIISVVLLASCDDKPPESRVSTYRLNKENDFRKTIGLSQISGDLTLFRNQFNAEDWRNSKNEFVKRVQYDDAGNSIWEEDYHYSGKNVVLDSLVNPSPVSEQLTVYYNYSSNELELKYVGIDSQIISDIKKTANSPPEEKIQVLLKILTRWKTP